LALRILTLIKDFSKELELLFKVFIYFGVYLLSFLYFITFLGFSGSDTMTGKYLLPPIIIGSLFLIGKYLFPLKYKTL
jgi:hypothetical protein